MYQSKNSKKRQKLIDSLENEKNKRLRNLQNSFLSEILAYLSDLETENGSLKNKTSNFVKIAALDAIQSDFVQKKVVPFLEWIYKSALKLIDINTNYFKEVSEVGKTIQESIRRTLFNRIGINSSGQLRKGGYLDGLGDVTKPFTNVKDLAVRSINNQVDIKSFRTTVKEYVTRGQDFGLLERELQEKTQDVFSVIDREIGNNYRKGLGLSYAIYQGGIIKTSRSFCVERNNKVYSVEEINSWRNLEWQGKSNPYNPFEDCGGYNCRHQLDWISDELAFRLRPDLKDE